ncbi:hypothetical protein BG000_008371, partial [Podila horticola]
MWKSIILPLVLQRDLAQHKRLVTVWNESKHARKKCWDDKRKKEKREEELDDHIDRIRNDTINQLNWFPIPSPMLSASDYK